MWPRLGLGAPRLTPRRPHPPCWRRRRRHRHRRSLLRAPAWCIRLKVSTIAFYCVASLFKTAVFILDFWFCFWFFGFLVFGFVQVLGFWGCWGECEVWALWSLFGRLEFEFAES